MRFKNDQKNSENSNDEDIFFTQHYFFELAQQLIKGLMLIFRIKKNEKSVKSVS